MLLLALASAVYATQSRLLFTDLTEKPVDVIQWLKMRGFVVDKEVMLTNHRGLPSYYLQHRHMSCAVLATELNQPEALLPLIAKRTGSVAWDSRVFWLQEILNVYPSPEELFLRSVWLRLSQTKRPPPPAVLLIKPKGCLKKTINWNEI